MCVHRIVCLYDDDNDRVQTSVKNDDRQSVIIFPTGARAEIFRRRLTGGRLERCVCVCITKYYVSVCV